MVGMVVGFTMGLAPAAAITWLKIADVARESMQSADQTATAEKSNPVLVPGTSSSQSTQTK